VFPRPRAIIFRLLLHVPFIIANDRDLTYDFIRFYLYCGGTRTKNHSINFFRKFDYHITVVVVDSVRTKIVFDASYREGIVSLIARLLKQVSR